MVGCDLPFLDAGLLTLLRDHAPAAQAAVPRVDSRPQALHARYGRAALPHVQARLQRGDLRLLGLLDDLDPAWLDEPALRAIDPTLRGLTNIEHAGGARRGAEAGVKVGVMGAGAIGGYLGGRLRAAGVPVVLVGRQALAEQTGTHGLRLTALDGYDRTLRPGELEVATTPAPLSDCDVVLVTVKSGATVAAARQLKPHLRDDATVVSFQNGVRNPSLLAAELGPRVLAAMVPFNVVWRADGHLHQGTSGVLHLEAGPRALPLLDALNRAGLPTRDEIDMRAVLWGKLLLNLNNPINALAGVPLRDELSTRAYRRVLAACQREALAALAQAGIAAQRGCPCRRRCCRGCCGCPTSCSG